MRSRPCGSVYNRPVTRENNMPNDLCARRRPLVPCLFLTAIALTPAPARARPMTLAEAIDTASKERPKPCCTFRPN